MTGRPPRRVSVPLLYRLDRVQLRRMGSDRIRRIVIAAAVLASVLVITLGGGYSASKALLADSVAFAVDGSGLDRLNAATGDPDAEILSLAKGTGRIRSVHRDGQLYIVDTDTNTVSRVDPGTLEVGPTTPPRPGLRPDKVTVVAGGGSSVLIDRGSNVVQRVDRDTLAAVGDPISIEGGAATAVVDPDGVTWVATKQAGSIVRIAPDGGAQPVPVAAQGNPLTVSLVDGRPVAVDTKTGAVVTIDPSSLKRSERARLANAPAGELLASAFDTPSPYLWLVDVDASLLFRVDLQNRKIDGPTVIGAGDLSWGQPVVQGARVHVPNLRDHTMVVVDVNTLRRLDEVPVPGSGPDFDVTLEGGALWANDPTNGTAVVVDSMGVVRKVGKGKGEGRLPDSSDQAPSAPLPLSPPGSSPRQPVAPPTPASPQPAAPRVVAPPSDLVVPDLNGLTRDQACAALRQLKLSCQSTDQDGGKVGKVTSQAPAAGATLRPASAVNVVIGRGIRIPKLQGTSRDAACGALASLKLRCLAQAVPLEPGQRRDEVFEQQPAEGGLADEGTTVTVRYRGAPVPVPVPAVVGNRLVGTGTDPQNGPACQKILSAGLACRPSPVPAKVGQPADQALSQSPASGSLDPGAAVTINYAATALVPAAAGEVQAACKAIRGLNLACTVSATGIGPNPGQSTGQSKPAGTELPAGQEVVVTTASRRPVVPNLAGMAQAAACNALAAESLGCSWQPNPANSIRNPGLVDAQSQPAGADAAPGAQVVLYHPTGPDATLARFQARVVSNGQPKPVGTRLAQWAIAPTAGPGRPIYDNLSSRPDPWPVQAGNSGKCYSSQVEGSVPMYDFMRASKNDPSHEDHFYAAGGAGSPQWERGMNYYFRNEPASARNDPRLLCFVVPNGSTGATQVTEWWEGSDSHFYSTTGGPNMGGPYTAIAQWFTW